MRREFVVWRSQTRKVKRMAKKAKSGTSGGVTWQKVLPTSGGVLGVLLLAALIYWGTRPSADALLEITSPTPAQIHQIAWTLLRHDDFKIRARATEKLRSLGQTAVPVLKDVAQTHPDAAVRKAVLDILLGLDPKAAADLVAQLSQDKNPDVQRTAISAAKHLDDPRSYEILDQGARSQDATTRQAAVEALGARRDPRAVPVLEAALRDPNASMTLQLHAARALQLITGRDYNDQVRRR